MGGELEYLRRGGQVAVGGGGAHLAPVAPELVARDGALPDGIVLVNPGAGCVDGVAAEVDVASAVDGERREIYRCTTMC